MPDPITKVSANVTAKTLAALTDAAARTGDTETDTIGRAIQLYAWICTTGDAGAVTNLDVRPGVVARITVETAQLSPDDTVATPTTLTAGATQAPDDTDQRELAPDVVAPTEPAPDLHRGGPDLSKAVEAAEREVPCLKGGGPRVLGVSVVDVPNRAETAVNVIAPHVLRAAYRKLREHASAYRSTTGFQAAMRRWEASDRLDASAGRQVLVHEWFARGIEAAAQDIAELMGIPEADLAEDARALADEIVGGGK